MKLYSRVEADQRIEYADFTSLYPWVNKYCTYPKGHPEIILTDFDESLKSYFGLASVKILPPHGLYHPVLPLVVRSGRLAFTLCARCADQQLQERCSCTTEQRALTGVWCTPEIQKAREMGYVVLKVYEVYHWNEVCSGEDSQFASCVDGWLKVKQESSGYPSELTTNEERHRYRSLYEEKEGICLDHQKMTHDPGVLGKWGEKDVKRKHVLIKSLRNFMATVDDPDKIPKDFTIQHASGRIRGQGRKSLHEFQG